jgi:hypothetical protein
MKIVHHLSLMRFAYVVQVIEKEVGVYIRDSPDPVEDFLVIQDVSTKEVDLGALELFLTFQGALDFDRKA